MADCAADVVLTNALENAVEFGNAFFRLGNFTLALLGLFFGFLEVLLFRGFLKCHPGHAIINEKCRIGETVIGCVFQKDFLLESDLSRVF